MCSHLFELMHKSWLMAETKASSSEPIPESFSTTNFVLQICTTNGRKNSTSDKQQCTVCYDQGFVLHFFRCLHEVENDLKRNPVKLNWTAYIRLLSQNQELLLFHQVPLLAVPHKHCKFQIWHQWMRILLEKIVWTQKWQPWQLLPPTLKQVG